MVTQSKIPGWGRSKLPDWSTLGAAAATLIGLGSASAQDAVAETLLDAIGQGTVTTDVIIDSAGVVEFSQLRDRIRENPGPALEEVVEYLAHESDYPKRLVVLRAVRDSQVSTGVIMDTIADDLVSTDQSVQEAAGAIASIHMGGRERDFGGIVSVLVEDKPVRNEKIIRWAMREDPHNALADVSTRLLVNSPATQERWRELQLAQHVVDDSLWREYRRYIPEDTMTPEADTTLDSLVGAEEWWVRLYVVEVMLRADFTATPARLAALCADPDPRITERVASLCPAAP